MIKIGRYLLRPQKNAETHNLASLHANEI